jgi:hypothetical protein
MDSSALKLDNNPPMSGLTRLFAAGVALVLIGGLLLFVAPHLILPAWPWKLAPFNARFLGAFYTAEGAVILSLLLTNRWSPGRLVLIMALVFTVVVTLVTLLHLDFFNWGRKGPWLWVFLYAGSAVVSALLLWQHWSIPQPRSIIGGTVWPDRLRIHGAVATAYGAAMLISPHMATWFWPWKIDVFHAQIYSALFLAAGIGALFMVRQATRHDLRTFGLANIILGIGAIVGLMIVDASVNRVDWTELGTLVWLFGFAVLALVGLAQLVDTGRNGLPEARESTATDYSWELSRVERRWNSDPDSRNDSHGSSSDGGGGD